MNPGYLKGFIFTALGVAILSFDAVLIRLIQVDSSSLLFWRGLFLGLMVFLWLSAQQRRPITIPTDPASIRSAILYTISSVCFVSAINLTPIANVLVIISAQPLMAAFMAHIFLGEKSPTRTWVAIFLSMCGIAWVMKDSLHSQNFAGDIIALVSALSLSAKFVNDRSVQGRNMTVSLIPAAVLIALFGLSFGQPLSLQSSDWIWMLLLCALVIPIAFTLISIGPMHIPAAEVGMLMLLETALGPIWAWLWLGETPSRAALQGGGLVFVTLLIHGGVQWRATQKLKMAK